MKLLLIYMLAAMTVAFSQDELLDDLDGDTSGAKTVNMDKECEYKTVDGIPTDKYDINDPAFGRNIKIAYSEGYRYYKSWQKESDPVRKKKYADNIERYFWKVIMSDPEGTQTTRFKSGRTATRLELSAEKLGDVYVARNDVEKLGAMLHYAKKAIKGSNKMTQFAVQYYNGIEDHVCKAKVYMEWVSWFPKTEDQRDNLKKIYKNLVGALQNDLKQNKLAIEQVDAFLKLEPEDEEFKKLKADLIGDPVEVYKLYLANYEKDNTDLESAEKAAYLAADPAVDELQKAYDLFNVLIKSGKDAKMYSAVLVDVAYKLQKYNDVIKYGKNSNDEGVLEQLIRAYVAKGQFQSAFNTAARVQRNNNGRGHYLKGLVFEQTAQAAQNNGVKDFEWRLIYRLAYIEYQLAGNVGSRRAKAIRPLIPTKGAIFLKSQRVKPKQSRFVSWIPWIKSYDREVYAPDS